MNTSATLSAGNEQVDKKHSPFAFYMNYENICYKQFVFRSFS